MSIVIAYTKGLDVIEFDNVLAVENAGDEVNPQIEVYLHGSEEKIYFVKQDAVDFVEQYTDWLKLKQAALGIEVENKEQGRENNERA